LQHALVGFAASAFEVRFALTFSAALVIRQFFRHSAPAGCHITGYTHRRSRVQPAPATGMLDLHLISICVEVAKVVSQTPPFAALSVHAHVEWLFSSLAISPPTHRAHLALR
jgi:hypothetical protein